MKIHAKADEHSIVDKIRGRSWAVPLSPKQAAVRIGIGDDAAVWRPRAGHEAILTCDWFLEGTHFLVDRHPPESVGWKCLARAVGDIAAMGGEPSCFLLSLALPTMRSGKWLTNFLNGLQEASRAFHCPIAGGDTTRRDEILINVTVIGECRRGRAILRSGAHAGDAIFVTGQLGKAEYGLRLIRARRKRVNPGDACLQKHLYPVPRLEVGAFLARQRLATAMMDLSDGLSSDLPRLCTASGVGARIEAEQVPRVRIAKRDLNRKFNATQLALHGGDDYELLFTVARKNVAQIPKAIGRVALTQIGEIISRKTISLTDESGATHRLENEGWDPFR